MRAPLSLKKLLFRTVTQGRPTPPARRLTLVALESRITPAVHTWSRGGLTGNWSDAANWDTAGVPTTGELGGTVVVIPSDNSRITQDVVGLVIGQLQLTNPRGTALTLATPLGIDGSAAVVSNVLVASAANEIAGTSLNLLVPDVAISVGPSTSLTVSSQLTGAGGFRKTGGGTLTLSGSLPNTYAGTATVADGTLALNTSAPNGAVRSNVVIGDGVGVAGSAVVRHLKSAQILDAAAVTLHSDGLLDVNDFADTVGLLTLDNGATVKTGPDVFGVLGLGGDLVVTGVGPDAPPRVTGNLDLGASSHAVTVADGPAPVDAVIDANVSGTGGLVKAGPGLLRLNGGSPYTGATLVAAGTLEVLGSLGRSSVTLAGGTLGGEGGLGSLTVTGGTVAPSLGVASAPGTLNVEALVFGAGVFAPQISGDFHDPADRLQVIGPVTLTGVVLTPTRTGPPLDVGDPFYILTNDSDDAVVGTFSGLPQGATLTVNGQLFAVSYADGDGNDVALRALTNPTPPVPVVPVVPPVIPPVTPPVTPKPALVGVPLFAAGTDAGTVGTATLYNADKSVRITVTPFGDFSGGVRVAAADFNGDGVADLAVGTGPGRATQVVVLDGVTQKVLFTIDPFEATFTGGVNVTAGDVTGDGLADLVITPDQGGGPRVRVFAGNTTAAAFAQYADFFGIDDKAFFGGARAGVADLDGDGVGDLIVSAGFGGGPRVAGYNGLTLGLVTPVKLFGDFLAFEADLRNGAFVTGGDLDGDGRAELIAGGGPGGGPRVTAFSGAVLLANQQLPLVNFFAGDVDSRGGVRVTVKNLDGDASADLVVGAGTAAGSRVTAYAGKSLGAVTPPELFAFDALAGFAGGVFVG